VVGHDVTTYTLQGIADQMDGELQWTNSLTGASGSIPHANPWSIEALALGVGENLFTVSGITIGTGDIETNALDSASAYGTSWPNNANEGFGFEPWQLTAQGTSGTFVGGAGWGLWSESGGNRVEAVRPFAQPLTAGDTFYVRMQNGWIWENGGSVGVALRNSAGNVLWQLSFTGGNAHYSTTAGATDIGWTDAGLDIVFQLTDTNSYAVAVTPVGGATRQYTGSFTGQIAQFLAWSQDNGTNDGQNSNRDYFVNNLMITSLGTGEGVSTSATVTITRLASGETDSNGDGIPDAWYIQFGYDPTEPDLAGQIGANGYTMRASYLMQLNPHTEGVEAFLIDAFNPDTGEVLWRSVGGRRYEVQFTDDLRMPFQTMAIVDLDVDGPTATHDPNGPPATGSRYYRIRFIEVID